MRIIDSCRRPDPSVNAGPCIRSGVFAPFGAGVLRLLLCVLCFSALSAELNRVLGQGFEIKTADDGVPTLNDVQRLKIESGSDTANAYFMNSLLGIGTTSPGAKLHLTSGAGAEFLVDNASEWQAKDSGGTAQGFLWPRWTDNVTYLNFGVGGFNLRNNASSSKVFIEDDGDVGIGTTTPTRQLDTTGNVKLNNAFLGDVGHGATWAGFCHNSVPGTGTYALLQNNTADYTLINKDADAGWIGMRVNNADMMVVRESGNVGIGTTAPPTKLCVVGSAYVATAMSDAGEISIKDAAPQINFDDTDNNDWAIHVNSNKMYFIREPWTFTDLVLDGAGNIGIGDASPVSKLCLHGNLRRNDGQLYFRGHGDNNHGISYQAGPPDGLQVYGYNGITIEDRNGGTTMLANFDTTDMVVGSNILESTSASGTIRLKDYNNGDVHIDAGGGTPTVYISSPNISKNFIIPHPADPGRLLVHSTLEGPEAAVFYRGEGRLRDGRAEIVLPGYFEALTQEEGRTVQLSPASESPDAPVPALAHSPVRGGRFLVKASDDANPGQAFTWEVKAVRKDIPPLFVEPRKGEVEVHGVGPYTYYTRRGVPRHARTADAGFSLYPD